MKLVNTVIYRLRQVRQQLGFVPSMTTEDYREVERWLSRPALNLFRTMTQADQQHSLRVCRGLQERGCQEPDMLAAALLHDVGKAEGRVPFWTRPAIVLGKRFAPSLLQRTVIEPERIELEPQPRWRQSISYAWYHAEVGALLAAATGLSERAILYIRTHHQPHGPAAELHQVDEVS
ncbi:hypothetical protein KDA_16960 [Dictyobacter alpinus]|uniref:HD domain-containing protein n=1 Tax=Dictyobacter alpinus TaxID=2014873 RepID=A0A402B4E7_9CHLR|nr:hypothetical protein [Dictyobacter alpinus]GCE26212.1 hypothetical protein KDA_16960 [Dictyobacter alpinus]